MKCSPEDNHSLNYRPTGIKCYKCGEIKEREYDEGRDEWIFHCACSKEKQNERQNR